jgi:hypothetical protein
MNGPSPRTSRRSHRTGSGGRFSSDVPSAEDVYDLRLTFYGGGDAVVGALTSRLAVVTGAFGAGGGRSGPSDRKWTRLRSSAVIPYDACWTEATRMRPPVGW